ncbi:uncharacterized protein [Eurosta solidaginis]|uniref:uncharacterized protein n=1 Tax=Eurosta solidaginis TaxID=178769 RepID=UPI0035316484
MYKTVRHGENSLQYTILPQNDDFRIEGKLSSAGSNCTTATGRKGKARRPKRRSFFAYLGLIFVCTVIVGAVLIPFLVSAECLPNPTEWFLKTKSALTHGGNFNGLHRNGGMSHDALRRVGEHIGIPHAPHHNSIPSIGQRVEIINRDGIERIILRPNKTQTQIQLNETRVRPIGYQSNKEEQPPSEINNVAEKANTGPSETQTGIFTGVKSSADATTAPEHKNITLEMHERNDAAASKTPSQDANNLATEVRFETGGFQSLADSTPTIVVTTARAQSALSDSQKYRQTNAVLNSNKVAIRPVQSGSSTVIRPTTSFSTTSIYSPHVPAGASVSVSASSASLANTNSNQNISAPAIPTITTRIMQLPLLKSTAKKPILPSVLVRTNQEVMSPEQPINYMGKDSSAGYGSEVASSISGSRVKGVIAAPDDDAVDMVETKNADWIQSHWPYVDPSTYFQWTGYKEDSVLLPALLGFALTGMILIIAICLVARNKRAIVSSVRKRNRNDVEEGVADDNTTLLTNSNLSDED